MITFSKLGKDGGNFGNQLHQIASLTGFSEKYGCDFIIPKWKYASYFLNPPKQSEAKADLQINEIHFHFTPEYWDTFKEDFANKTVDIGGWLQCEKYWSHCREKVF